MKLSEIIIDKPDFDRYYESTSYPMCENNSDKIEDMTIEDFKWEACNNFFKEGVEQALDNITPQVAIDFASWKIGVNIGKALFEEFLKQYKPDV